MSVTLSTDQDFGTHLSANEMVIVKYFATWCGSCKLFSPKFKRLSDDERFTQVTFLDVNAEENSEARKLAGVDNLPYFAVFKNGKLVNGGSAAKEEYVVDLLNQLISNG
jgi:thiol-disulfide isomerase/thioredoxin